VERPSESQVSRPSASIQVTRSLEVVRQGSVNQRFFERLVTVFIFTYCQRCDGDFVFWVVGRGGQYPAAGEIPALGVDAKIFKCKRVNAFRSKSKGNFINGWHVAGGD